MTPLAPIAALALLFAALGDWDAALLLGGVAVLLAAVREERG